MKLTREGLKRINNPATRRRLMDVFGCTEFTIARYIQKNSDNLTKASAMQAIREATGLPDGELLEEKTSRKRKTWQITMFSLLFSLAVSLPAPFLWPAVTGLYFAG